MILQKQLVLIIVLIVIVWLVSFLIFSSLGLIPSVSTGLVPEEAKQKAREYAELYPQTDYNLLFIYTKESKSNNLFLGRIVDSQNRLLVEYLLSPSGDYLKQRYLTDEQMLIFVNKLAIADLLRAEDYACEACDGDVVETFELTINNNHNKITLENYSGAFTQFDPLLLYIDEIKKSLVEVPSDDYFNCSKASDCVLLDKGCCSCSEGGFRMAMHYNYADYFKQKQEKDCLGIMCTQVISSDASCSMPVSCESGKCLPR